MKIAGYLAAALLAAGVLAWILSSRLQGVIAGPVDDLARTAAEVSASKNFNLRAVKHGEDELGVLTDSFNTMLETIQDRDDALRDSEVKYRDARRERRRRDPRRAGRGHHVRESPGDQPHRLHARRNS